MTNNTQLGQQGERVAEAHFLALGYQVLERNFRYKRAEVDLIVAKGKTMVLVEVKSRSSYSFGFPEAAVTAKKEALLLLAANHYIELHQWPYEVRFDIVSILWTAAGQPEILHIEDAFH